MKIIAKGWGTKSDIEKPEFKRLIKKLKIIPWSRKWEWPFAILNSDIKKGLRVLSAGCLHYTSYIQMENGEKLHIGKVVNQKIQGKVLSYNIEKKIFESKKIIGWHKNPINNRNWYKIRYKHAPKLGTRGRFTWVTEDHLIFTVNRDWVKAKNLKELDETVVNRLAPNDKQKQLILGGLLGDSGLEPRRKNSKSACLSFTHSDKQKAYFEKKADFLKDITSSIKMSKSYRAANPNTFFYRWRSPHLPFFKKELSRWYPNGKKIIPKDLTSQDLTPLVLAIWYIDDGRLRKNSCELATYGFTKQESKFLSQLLCELGYKSHLCRDGNYWGIWISSVGAKKFFQDIAPFVIPSMRYKLSPNFSFPEFDPALWSKNSSIFFRDKIIAEKGIPSQKRNFAFDIDVEDNHNFLSNDMIFHNCVGDPTAKYCIQKGCETHGIDLSNHSLPGLDFKNADIRNTPYRADYFDRIFCISVIEHIWDSPTKSIEELLRILKPGGRLAITTDINCGGGSFLFHQPNFDGLIGLPLGFETGKIPEDVLRSVDSEIGIVCGRGLRVFGFVVEK